MVAREGFEPSKHYAQNLKSCPFDQTRVSRIINWIEKKINRNRLETPITHTAAMERVISYDNNKEIKLSPREPLFIRRILPSNLFILFIWQTLLSIPAWKLIPCGILSVMWEMHWRKKSNYLYWRRNQLKESLHLLLDKTTKVVCRKIQVLCPFLD